MKCVFGGVFDTLFVFVGKILIWFVDTVKLRGLFVLNYNGSPNVDFVALTNKVLV